MKLFQIDAFTDTPFQGNPAGVAILPSPMSEEDMQNIALEMNCSETAFLFKDDNYYRIRYFTPVKEVPLCGHATLSAGYVIYNYIDPEADELLFKAPYDDLYLSRSGSWISMKFPKDQFSIKTESDELIEKSLKIKTPPVSILYSRFGWYLAVFESPDMIREISPDFAYMTQHDLAIIITAESEDSDFVSRVFAPGWGINEDPVTGLAHCTLGEYWSSKKGKTDFIGKQLSRRGGIVKVRVTPDANIISGQAVMTFEVALKKDIIA